MAFGKPVIGGNHGGTPDVIRDGVTGFLVEYGDVNGLTSRILSLLQYDGLRKQMGLAGLQYVEENFTFTHFQRRLDHIPLQRHLHEHAL
jgi:glycosyltransferase involved in cell wall biosynthesis